MSEATTKGLASRWPTNVEVPRSSLGHFDVVPGEALAEDTRYELVRAALNTLSNGSPP
ncbi:hypothetical protein SBRY_50326 [Actinacidiphila bryophytorum]|uniref:Uncharacterized protein n=1 Tax=Actinacidiphila bryophytorum TaxID=1436133 RepID=A0A9W4H4R5_9ACTN|nr:hypothetical protein SBRY_50326 [Actinacidiphila bryophytorum]